MNHSSKFPPSSQKSLTFTGKFASRCSLLVLILAACFMSVSAQADTRVYEDAEDGNANGWVIYDNSPAGASVSVVTDSTLGSKVIQFTGTGTGNGFRLGNTATTNGGWNDTSRFNLSWRMRTGTPYQVYVAVRTTYGFRYLHYDASNTDNGLYRNYYVHHGLGSATLSNDWTDIDRDLAADLASIEPGNKPVAVHGFLVRGNLRLDDLALYNNNTTTVSPPPASTGPGPWDPDPTSGPIVQVSDYAVSGRKGQTSQLKAALAAAAGGRLVFGPGTWYVAAQKHGALIPAANTTVYLDPAAVVRQEPTSDYQLAVFRLDKPNTHIRGRGKIVGELRGHTGTTGEHTFLVYVTQGARNWTVIGPTIAESWGDGIYVGGIAGTGPVIGGLIDHVIVDSNRRQGISVTWSESLRLGNNVKLINTGQLTKALGLPRQRPTSGLDLEPHKWSWVTDMVIGSILSENNLGSGITVQSPHSDYKPTTATINGATVRKNGDPDEWWIKGSGLEIKEGGFAKVTNIRADNNIGSGVIVRGARGTRTFQGKIHAIGGTANNNGEYGWALANDSWGGYNILDGVSGKGNVLGDVVDISGQGNSITIAD